MRRAAAALLTLALAAAAALAVPGTASAHGLGGLTNLPIPGWMFLVGGGTVLVVSFVGLAVLWPEPQLVPPDAGRPMPRGMQRVILARAVELATRALGLALFVLVWSAAAFGSDRAFLNLAPSFVYVVFWVGLGVLVVLFGDIWRTLDPWRTVADVVAWIGSRLGVRPRVRAYPAALGVWPAVVLLLAFVTLELVYDDPGSPRALAVAILVYSIATWGGAALFGRDEWRRNGDGFALYFGFLSKLALVGTRARKDLREAVFRRPLAPLTASDHRRGIVAFLALMLGSVAFDGFTGSTWWQDLVLEIQKRLGQGQWVDEAVMAVTFAGLIATVVLFGLLFLLALAVARRIATPALGDAGVFVYSLIPIAFVYSLAHYLTYLIYQSQYGLKIATDPYARGWDLLGLASWQPKQDVLTPNQTWYIQLGVLVVGHVAALIVAHDRAVALAPNRRLALRSQYATLALMVVYTVGGMWLLTLT